MKIENIKIMNSNNLKIVAIMAMIIDHIGYYFSFCIDPAVYSCMRIIGRIAMPIFAFLLVQGYLNTSKVNKYIGRLFTFALITQIFMIVLYLVNIIYIPEYEIIIAKSLNILFSFSLSLCILVCIDKKRKIINVETENKELINFFEAILRIIIIISIIIIYSIVKIDYGFIVPIMVLGIYFFEKLNKNYLIKENNYNDDIKSIIYYIGISLVIITCGFFEVKYGQYVSLSLIFILLYNFKLGKKSKFLQRMYYLIFPLQHIILYALALYLLLKT